MSDKIESEGPEADKEGAEPSRIEEAQLDETTLEPEARVELAGDYVEAEAIERALTDSVDGAAESQQPAGGESPDPSAPEVASKRYSGVEMQQGEVFADQDWNEEADSGGSTPGETVAKIDSFTQEVGRAEREVQGEIGFDFKPIPADEISLDGSPLEQVAKVDSFTHELDEHSEDVSGIEDRIALDGKGGSQPALDGEGAMGEIERTLPDLGMHDDRAAESVIPEVEAEAGGVDFKFFQPQGSGDSVDIPTDAKNPAIIKRELIDAEIPTDAKAPAYIKSEALDLNIPDDAKDQAYVKSESGDQEGTRVSENLQQIIGKAISEPGFREQLVQNPEAILREYDLTEIEREQLIQIDPVQMEAVARELETRFAEGDDPAAQEALNKLFGDLLWGSGG